MKAPGKLTGGLNWFMTVRRTLAALAVAPCLLWSAQGAVAVEIQEIGEPSVVRSDAPRTAPQRQVQAQPKVTRVESSERTPRSSSVLVSIARQQQELQLEVERLRSENEELNHTIEGLQRRLRSMYSDLDRRIQEIEKRGAAPAVTTTAMVQQAGAGDSLAESKAYEHAFNLLRNKRYAPAIKAFDRFLQTYPDSEFADNAQYWIGEGYYVMRDFKAAIKSFSRLIASHPESAKVADAYLKLGFSQYEMADYANARKSLELVTQRYAKTTAARLAKERLDRMSKEGR